MLQAEGDLNARGSAADDSDLQWFFGSLRERVVDGRTQSRQKGLHRFDCQTLFVARGQGRAGADADRQQVVMHGGAMFEEQPLAFDIVPFDFAVNKTDTARRAEPHQVDLHILRLIIPSQRAGQHTGVSRNGVVRDAR